MTRLRHFLRCRLCATNKECIEIAVLVLVGVTTWPLVTHVSTLLLMQYVYPALVGVHLLAFLILVWRYLFVIRTPLMPGVILYVLTQGFGYAVLALATAPHPLIVFDEYRGVLVWTRFLALGAISTIAIKGVWDTLATARRKRMSAEVS